MSTAHSELTLKGKAPPNTVPPGCFPVLVGGTENFFSRLPAQPVHVLRLRCQQGVYLPGRRGWASPITHPAGAWFSLSQMVEPIVYMDISEVLEGQAQELAAAMDELIAFVKDNEPQIVSYSVYFNEDRSQMTVVHVHRDPASLRTHMEVAGHLFPKMSRFIKLLAINVYGELPEDLIQKMRQKAEMLGTGKVLVHQPHGGFGRFSS